MAGAAGRIDPMVGRSTLERAFEKTGHALSGALDVLLDFARRRLAQPDGSGVGRCVRPGGALALGVGGRAGVPAARGRVPVIVEPGPG